MPLSAKTYQRTSWRYKRYTRNSRRTFCSSRVAETIWQPITAESWQTSSSTLSMSLVETRCPGKVDRGSLGVIYWWSTRYISIVAILKGRNRLMSSQIDLAEAVGADLSVMERDAGRMRYDVYPSP